MNNNFYFITQENLTESYSMRCYTHLERCQ